MTLNSIDKLLNSILSQPQWEKQRRYYELKKIWYEIVNQKIAQHTSPIYLKEEVFFIATQSAVWAQELSLQRRTLIIKINRRIQNPIKDIYFVFGKWYSQNTPPIPEAETNLSHPSLVESTEFIAQPIETPQEALQQWFEIIKQRAKNNSTCPCCQSFCPEGELNRWGICAYCFRENNQ
ncbi:DUF721 domain-containing protein [Cyanobacterium aponinum UTEX 3222]|uniref:DUF721 domain-containing protein n=1 Tax=Cyanobacterium aponinum TaxID=379064 RepID=UPI0030907A8D|nr:DUF721 domain-containing protein [Cyanobacterium aponinum UTEX 3222]